MSYLGGNILLGNFLDFIKWCPGVILWKKKRLFSIFNQIMCKIIWTFYSSIK